VMLGCRSSHSQVALGAYLAPMPGDAIVACQLMPSLSLLARSQLLSHCQHSPVYLQTLELLI
jgi:hypothetical protein